jgi:DNA topoisomerase IB
MANELTALTNFNRNLFKHAFIILPWFVRNAVKYKYTVSGYGGGALLFIEAIRKDGPEFFGNTDCLGQANEELSNFYTSLKPNGYAKSNKTAIKHYRNAWQHAWKNRNIFQFRHVEVKLMQLFHAVICKGNSKHLPQLISMARLIDKDVVKLARSIRLPNGWTARANLYRKRKVLKEHKKTLFGRRKVNPKSALQARILNPAKYKAYQKAAREYKEAARLRIIEIFDTEEWFHIVDSRTLYRRLEKEKLQHLLPKAFKGRIGVQNTGYPLTFYTYSGLELEKAPLNKVKMNPNYGIKEDGKDYRIHPVTDGTFYCQTEAVVGHAKCKHYTLDYKRRARKIKYRAVAKLERAIIEVRARMLAHLSSKHRDTWVRALMCLFIDSKCARIGNNTSANGKNKTYGVTTLLTKEHVRVKNNKIIISYTGKHNQPQKHVFEIYRTKEEKLKHPRSSLIADRLLELISEDNGHLFTRENGKAFTAKMVNEYFTANRPDLDKSLPGGGAGAPCTVHNIRNYHATRIFRELALDFAHQKSNPSYEDVLAAYLGPTRAKPKVKGFLLKISEKLQNTPAICRKAYIDPQEQLAFFKKWGYRPPDTLINDLFITHDLQSYHWPVEKAGIDKKATKKRKVIRFKEKRVRKKVAAR